MKSQNEFIKMLEDCETSLDSIRESLEGNLNTIKETVKEFDAQKGVRGTIDDFSEREKELLSSINIKVDSVDSLIKEYNNL